MSIQNTKQRTIHSSLNYLGFTLVELIVVITILVILGTIAFLNLGGFSASARDSVRISNLANLKKWLDIFQIKSWVYPKPEGSVEITASGTIIGYQWFAREQIETITKLSPWATADPADPTIYTTYSTNFKGTKMQAMVFMEEGGKVSTFVPDIIPMTFANPTSDYSIRFPNTTWDTLGILLSNGTGSMKNQPVQESGTGVDVVNTTESYILQFSNDEKISGSGMVLKTGIISAKWLVGYWNFDEGSGTIAYDISSMGNNGTLSGSSVTWTGGKVGWAGYFPGDTTSSVIIQSGWLKGFDDIKSITISSWVYYDSGSLSNNYAVIVGKYEKFGLYLTNDAAGKRESWCPYVFYYPSANIYTDSNPYTFLSGGMGQCTSGKLPTEQWVHLVWVYDWKVTKFYQDGILRTQSRGQINQINQNNINNYNLTIGKGSFGVNSWKWYLDEIRIYNRVLSDLEVRALYYATK